MICISQYYFLKWNHFVSEKQIKIIIYFLSFEVSHLLNMKSETTKYLFLIQLYQYPGYDGTELTALPDDIPAIEMLKKATEAQMELYKKVNI